MNFKVLPPGADPDSVAFAEHPLGSGPFVFGGTGTKDGRHYAPWFTANPYYGAPRPAQDRPAVSAGDPLLSPLQGPPVKRNLSSLGKIDLVARPDGKGGGRDLGDWPASPCRRPPSRTGASTSWRSTTASRRWPTPPSAAPSPTPSNRDAPCSTTISGRGCAGPGPAHAAERAVPRQVMGQQPRPGPQARRQGQDRPVQPRCGQGPVDRVEAA